MKIVVASDPFGFDLKEVVKEHLLAQGHEVMDVGTQSKSQPMLYYMASDNAAKAVQSGKAQRGIVFCGTGMGVGIVANKHKGIYCAVVESQWAAHECREINNANMLALGGRLIGDGHALSIVDTFLNTEWMDGCTDENRKQRLTDMYHQVQVLEDQNFR